MKKILVTGGAGFIGTNLIERLLVDGNFEITSLDCYFTGKKDNHLQGVRYITGYTWDIDSIFKDEKFDLICHFGEYSRIVKSFDDISFVSNSILSGTPKVFEFARKCDAKVIYSASSSKFGNGGLDENLSPYAWMKAKMVELLKNYNYWFGLNFEIAYFFNVYGKRQIYEGNYATVIAIFESQYLRNKPLTVVKPGTQSRDFTHVNDITSGLIKLLSIDYNYEWYLRSGVNIEILDVARLFTNDIIFIPERRGERFTSEYFESDTEEKLGWVPIHSLEEWVDKIKNKRKN